MAEQTFKSPGFFEKEINLTARDQQKLGIPAGVIGTAKSGPAFVPITVGSMTEFETVFGGLDSEKFGPYAVNEFLKNRTALTYIRVLGCGANDTDSDILTHQREGTAKNAGFVIKGDLASNHGAPNSAYHAGCVQFLVGNHEIHDGSIESTGYPIFTDNDSFGTGQANIVRGMLFLSSGSRFQILDHDAFYGSIAGASLEATTGSITSYDNSSTQGTFKLVLSSSASSHSADGFNNVKIYTASLNQDSDYYISKILNTDPKRFNEEYHLLYAHFPVENEIARVKYSATEHSEGTVALLSGSTDTFRNNFGRFDVRYSNARTTSFISQPYGDSEYDLFHFETIDDGAETGTKFKISISNIKRSIDPLNPYGSFNVEIRNFGDNDNNTEIIENFVGCNLDPNSENYIARRIGDQKLFFNFEGLTEDERRLTLTGKFNNVSRYVRVVMNVAFNVAGNIPKDALPFGFRGIPALITNGTLKDEPGSGSETHRLTGKLSDSEAAVWAMSGSILPPMPMTVKATRGRVKEVPNFAGHPGSAEAPNPNIYWGVKTTRIPLSSSFTKSPLATNDSSVKNELVENYVKFLGNYGTGLDVMTTGSASDTFNNNKFSLSKVAFFNVGAIAAQITGSANDHILEAMYIRNGKPDSVDYLVSDGARANRITLASLVAHSDAKYFNRFSDYNKFTNVFYGGFDGLNILDEDMRKMNDKSCSDEGSGKAVSGDASRTGLHSDYTPGVGLNNNHVRAYRTATKILLDPLVSNVNIATIPGQRDPLIVDNLIEKTEEYGKALALIDIPNYKDDDGTEVRLFDNDTTNPSVRVTSEKFTARALDSSYAATYFPNIKIEDENTKRILTVPGTIAALGALGFNDSVSYPWFAPAGFNRGSLEFVKGTNARLSAGDRDTLYESRINPIANFPSGDFVIFGQKTLQFAKTSLDRVNVRRMLLEVRRLVSDVANQLLFEQNNQATRNRFMSLVNPLLASIQSQQGIDSFRVIMDSSNNTPQDAEQNRLNGRIVLVPTRAVEFIAIDFIITNSGVSFE